MLVSVVDVRKVWMAVADRRVLMFVAVIIMCFVPQIATAIPDFFMGPEIGR